jgi:3-phenylpropionate/trans-cinnamate dioxygenase ferredoxin reductase subunit
MSGVPIVIAGAGHAGVLLAEALRRRGSGAPIVLVGDEPGLPHERPPLSKAYLADGGLNIALRPAAFYADHDINLISGRRVLVLRRHERAVELDDGTRLDYGHLVFATGARCRQLDVPGAGLRGVHTLRTRADADRLRDGLRPGARLVLVGAGFIGLEIASAAVAAGCDTTVVEVADRVMGRAVSPAISAHAARAHERAGTRVRLRTGVVQILGSRGEVTGVETTDGDFVPADLVVVGIGVVPNVAAARSGGLQVAGGIVVDRYLRTSDPAISAIGDCAVFPIGTRRVRLESVQNAADQARCVAARLTGTPGPYRELPWFWSHQGGLKLQIAGLLPARDTERSASRPSTSTEHVVRGDPASGRFSVLTYDGGELACVESVNSPADHLAARRLLTARTTPDPAAAADPSVALRDLLAA